MTRLSLRIQGSRTAESAFASINQRWWTELARRPDVELVDDRDPREADIVIHHDFSTRFGDAIMAPARYRVAVRPWDFGPYPARWVETIRATYDELWVHSTWLARSATAGGVAPERVRQIPLGVDPAIMRPDGPRADLGVGDRFVFAFVGGAVHRKGIDTLLRGFARAFGHRRDVALVIKDHTHDVFYRNQSYRDRILEARSSMRAPIVYIDEYMPPAALAAIYRRADAFVLPYRSEGFACPVLEAMACGTPAIIPNFGACLDYCDETTGVLVPTRAVTLPVRRTFTTNSLGFGEYVDTVQFSEMPVDALVRALTAMRDRSPESLAAMGHAAAERARTWTWAASVDTMLDGARAMTASHDDARACGRQARLA